MSDNDDDIEKRRGFLRQVVGVGSALPFAGGIAPKVPAVAVAQAATPSAPAAVALIGYVSFSQDEAAFVRTSPRSRPRSPRSSTPTS